MAKILVLYPHLFNCFSKFSRKVSKITSSLDDVELVYSEDPNHFIERFCAENLGGVSSTRLQSWSQDDVTHAIVFDDGEEFSSEVDLLKNAQVPLRCIRIQITRVINIKSDTNYQAQGNTPHYEYIGRGSYWGNPYSMFEDGDRDEVIRKFKYDFDYDKFLNVEKSKVYSLAGKRLGCFCKPQACHGDVLADFLNSWDDGK
ncbi:TPA: DUF4326 domain-containing protein [Vibrio harveyi]|nr:DUF4326 domain-containing protein [Vibrio harveyi]HDM8181704.1 DUF4326 domain-containing protein [Vibrio harveyi]